MKTLLKQVLASVLFGGLLLGLTPALAGARDFKALYVFGDSLGDPGNAYVLSDGTFPDPVAYPFHRFSNGIVAPEWLARFLKVQSRPHYAHHRGTNFAVGGATTGVLNFNFAINFPDLHLYPELATSGVQGQILDSIADGPEFKPGKTLFLVWGGVNDIFLSLTLDPTGSGLTSTLAQAVANLSEDISLLAHNGARHFVVLNLPNLGATPAFNAGPLATNMNVVSVSFNSALSTAMAQLQTQLGTGVQIRVFDTYTFVNTVIQSPTSFGFTNVTTSCLDDLQQPACTGYLFYDSVHPTTAAHRLVAQALYELLNN